MNEKKGGVFHLGKGWGLIAFCFVTFFIYGGMNVDGLNITVPFIADNMGVEQGVLFTLVSYASMIGVLVNIIWGQAIRRIGPRNTVGFCLIIAGCSYFVQARATNIPMFLISTCLIYGCMMTAAFMGGGILVANYYPKRKGLVMGYTTMGLNAGSAFYVIIITALIGAMGGLSMGVVPICIAAVVLGVICLAFVKNTPQEIGMVPDNISEAEYKENYDTEGSVTDDGSWTTKKLLRTPMLWGVAVATGVFNIATGCLVSNMVPRNLEMGMSQGMAVGSMTVVAVIGLFGSWLVGVIDERLGTKRTMIYFGIFYFLGGFLNWTAGMTGSMAPLYISILIIGIGVGGSANFTTSLAAQVFGRHSFDKVNSVLFPAQSFVTALNFLVSGLLRIVTNNDLKWIFLGGGIVCLINLPVLLFIIRDEHKYNRDWKAAEQKAAGAV